MQIHRLALKNFKCFKEVDVSFSKITLLTGENSSRKSSLIYGILAPLQSSNRHGDSFPFHLSFNGSYVNMGGFQEVSFNHNLNNRIGIGMDLFLYEGINQFGTLWDFDAISKSPKLNYLKNIDSIRHIEIQQQENGYYIGKQKDGKTFTQITNNLSKNDYFSSSFLDDEYSRLDNLEYDKYCSGDDISYLIYSEFTSNFNFISSFRLHPDRTYYQSIMSDKVDKFGGGYIDQILDWTDRGSGELYELVSILKDLKILYDMKPHRLSGGRFEIKIKVKSKSKWESLADVGFGISQFLPIIVADLQLWDNSTLIMSQPEIHLHPSVQADLGNYLIKQVKERNKNYIVETHSEYLLNRIRLLIVNEEIQPEDVAVYYFENSIKNGSVAHRIEFTKQGQILNAPKGFFETYMIDTMDIALNA
jgi:hypothetical protein